MTVQIKVLCLVQTFREVYFSFMHSPRQKIYSASTQGIVSKCLLLQHQSSRTYIYRG